MKFYDYLVFDLNGLTEIYFLIWINLFVVEKA